MAVAWVVGVAMIGGVRSWCGVFYLDLSENVNILPTRIHAVHILFICASR